MHRYMKSITGWHFRGVAVKWVVVVGKRIFHPNDVLQNFFLSTKSCDFYIGLRVQPKRGKYCYIWFSLSPFYWLSQHSDSAPNVTSLRTDYSSTCYTFCIYTYFQFQVFFYCSQLLHVLLFTLPHAFTFLSMCSDSVHDLFRVTMTFHIFMTYLRYAPNLSWHSI